ncbi:MAG: hypothetical protein IPG74_15460 [Flavobacteriales bacterium]|nr:hypothetical protein [Flavobacteriales bacterium]
MAGMLPEKTTLTFNENQQLAELSAGMGVFRTSMMVNNEQRRMDYHLSVLSKKLVSNLQEKDMAMFNRKRKRPWCFSLRTRPTPLPDILQKPSPSTML